MSGVLYNTILPIFVYHWTQLDIYNNLNIILYYMDKKKLMNKIKEYREIENSKRIFCYYLPI